MSTLSDKRDIKIRRMVDLKTTTTTTNCGLVWLVLILWRHFLVTFFSMYGSVGNHKLLTASYRTTGEEFLQKKCMTCFEQQRPTSRPTDFRRGGGQSSTSRSTKWQPEGRFEIEILSSVLFTSKIFARFDSMAFLCHISDGKCIK